MTETDQGENLEILRECPICTSTESTVTLTLPDPMISTSLLVLNRCSNCAFTYLNPRLSCSAVAKLETSSEVYDYPPDKVESTIDQLAGVIQFVEAYSTGRGLLLDVGSNRGMLLEAARRSGWQVTGVELSAAAANRARRDFGHQVFRTLDDIPEETVFDVITCWHVLEHMPNPLQALKQIRSKLGDGGIMALQVPSFDFLEEFARRSMISRLVCAVHNSYFTEESLRMVLHLAGFVPRSVSNNSDDLMLTAMCSKTSLRSWLPLKARSLASASARRLSRYLLRHASRPSRGVGFVPSRSQLLSGPRT